jgi:hypothetical protein
LIEDLKQKYDDFDETILSIFFMLMSSKGRYKILGQKMLDGKTVYTYKDLKTGKIYSLDIQEGIVDE